MGHIMNVLGGCGYGDFDPDASGKGAATWTGPVAKNTPS